MKNGIAVVEHLRENPGLVSALPDGVYAIGHSRVPPGTKEPYVVVLGGDGETPQYTFGLSEAFGDDVVCVMAVGRTSESETHVQMVDRILDLIHLALQNAESMSYLELKNRKVLCTKYIGPAKSSEDVISEQDFVMRAGRRYEITTAPQG